MTLTQLHHDPAQPIEGNRSPSYIGVELRFDQRYFHITSDSGIGPRPDPRFKVCDRVEHTHLRELLCKKAKEKGMTEAEAMTEWTGIVRQATVECTKLFREAGGFSGLDVVPWSDELNETLRTCLHDALAWIAGQINRRLRHGAWTVKPAPEFPFSKSRTIVYVHRQNRSSHERDGLKAYKIGKTTNPKQRKKAHKTSNPDTTEICEFPECGVVTEANIHKLFSPPIVGATEWFLLSDEQVATLTSFFRLQAAIVAMLERAR
jgi:hypothetical protein